MKSAKHHKTERRIAADFTAIAYETDVAKDCDYLLHMPNGETMWLECTDEEGPTIKVGMWPGDDETYIEVRNDWRYVNNKDLR